jgi:hypothetical protein
MLIALLCFLKSGEPNMPLRQIVTIAMCILVSTPVFAQTLMPTNIHERVDALEALVLHQQAQIDQKAADIAALQSELAATQSELADNTAADTAAHHARYMDAEAIAAVGPHFSGNHADLSNVTANQHHVPTSTDLTAINDAIAFYDELFYGVSRLDDPYTSQDTLRFSNMNVQVVNGSGQTDDSNGTGNLIVGYNETGNVDGDVRIGSHMLVIGTKLSYLSYGGMVVGSANTTSGAYSSVSGGIYNEASGENSSVSGGYRNMASGRESSVSGGRQNIASVVGASVSGGRENEASGAYTSVSAGYANDAIGIDSSVSGGIRNAASGPSASVSGGSGGIASDGYTSVSGGFRNIASFLGASVSGGHTNIASGATSSVSGGRENEASGEDSSVSGGNDNIASGKNTAVSGGVNKTATTDDCTVGDNGVDC